MDPTLVRGNVFSSKGAQNHILCNTWKDQVRKEQELRKKWKSIYHRQATPVNAENEKVLYELSAPRAKRAPSPRQDLLPALRESSRDNITQHLHVASLAPYRPASRDIGSAVSLALMGSRVLDLDRRSGNQSYGHRPILQSSFFRVNGVF